jgi:organic hydroperoxide reductase OsmC/OhrA
MEDLTIELDNAPGSLATMGEVLGRAGVSVEGGGAAVYGDAGIGHFLFRDGDAARRILEAAKFRVLDQREVLVQRLAQERPGQLGSLAREMADANVNIETLYSDHNHQLIITVDDIDRGRTVSETWEKRRQPLDTGDARSSIPKKLHGYDTELVWVGNSGSGTRHYSSYSRNFAVNVAGKASINGSSDPSFRGDKARYNPEELLVASLASCHMLWYLHLCAENNVVVVKYEDHSKGAMQEFADGSGIFVNVFLRPSVTITRSEDLERAAALHHDAHSMCFIARSMAFPVTVEPATSVLRV